jgi:hypothetical protein
LWLFDDYILAKTKGEEWEFNKQGRELLEVEITLLFKIFKADSKWLNCNPAEYTGNARQYWSGQMSSEPEPEILLDGKIKPLGFDWQSKCKLLTKAD